MTAHQREQLRRELIGQLTVIYQTVRNNLSAAYVSQAVEHDPEDEGDESAIDELRALDSDLDDRQLHLAHAMVDALRRMGNDQYGIGIDCGREIPFERLRAVPWTLRCAEDAARVEHGNRTYPTL
jgi:RNA polymerase-binding transcription factor DksA